MFNKPSRRQFCGLSLMALGGAWQATCASPLWAEEYTPGIFNNQVSPVYGLFGRLNDPDRFGHESTGKHCFVRCNTDDRDARAVADEFALVWEQMGRLADPWTDAYRRPPFPSALLPEYEVGPVMIFVDATPLNQDRAAASTFQIVGNATMIYLNVGPGEPELAEQLPRLRLAAAHAFLSETRLAEQLPASVCDGMAGYVARLGLKDPRLAAMQVEGMIRFQGENRRRRHGSWARQPGLDASEQDDIDRFRFLVEGEDCQHTFELFAALRSLADRPLPRDATRLREASRPFFLDPPSATPVESLVERYRTQFESWEKDPLAGQPVFAGEDQPNRELQARQDEMMLVLKLARRFHRDDAPPTLTPNASSVRVVEFGRGATPQPPSPKPDDMLTLEQLRRILLDPTREPWATVDVDGSLLLSTDRERILELLGDPNDTYREERRDGHRVLTYQSDHTRLEAWLETNPENARRPLAKFVVAKSPLEASPRVRQFSPEK